MRLYSLSAGLLILLVFNHLALAELSQGVGHSVDDSLIRGALGNRRVADNLFAGALADGKRGVSSFPPNVGLLVRAVRQGLRGVQADLQSKSQANWALNALQTESTTNEGGVASNHLLGIEQIRALANHKSSAMSAVTSKLGQAGIHIDQKQAKIKTPNNEFPLDLSHNQLRSELSNMSNQDMQTVMNRMAHDTLGIPNFISVPEIVAQYVRNQILNGIDSSEAAVQSAVNQGLAQANTELDQLKKQSLQDSEPTLMAAQTPPAVDGELAMIEKLNQKTDSESNSTKSVETSERVNHSENEPKRRIARSIQNLQDKDSGQQKIGRITDDIFEMLTFRYKMLAVQDRLLMK